MMGLTTPHLNILVFIIQQNKDWNKAGGASSGSEGTLSIYHPTE